MARIPLAMLRLTVMTDRMSPHEWLMEEFERRRGAQGGCLAHGVFTRDFMELIDDTEPVYTSRQMRWYPLQLQLADGPAQPDELGAVIDAGIAP